ncbi:TFIIB-type zinc ribbon-containing protein [Anaerostipes butyraticus]|uniref:Transcription factor zinc-finger domain-containing protein n=1 Tax=Anaerostipes butyraticus TaxID=645466 RepID=A0A916Q879_9FIRM|nr:zf-TFIIB domain-containing protein [Anaerostipes butyraticus]GFO86027.1 hypothetical protein ANBU17_23740 [Anaerostipes butyraticus]HJC83371.1 zf-TFIIB domain-containing protein [Candidatus Anaerostipes avicola]
MKCPVCKDVTLLMSEKHGVEIDYCPECRGIWLDRGELDKIIERASAYDDGYDRDEKPKSKEKSKHNQKPKKKSAFLGDILEIFGGD